MHILIDGDACPVISQTIQIAKEFQIPVTILADSNHHITSEYAKVITISPGNDAVDFALIPLVKSGDLVITQDYGVASLALAKGAYALHQSGKEYTPQNIDLLLFERHLSSKQRRGKNLRSKSTPKRTEKDNETFSKKLSSLLSNH